MDSKPPGSSGTFFPSKNSFVSRFLNPVFVPNRTNQAESSAPSIRSPSASRKLGNSICRSLSSRNASPVPLIELEITNSLCHLCTNIFQSNIPLSPPDRPRSHLQKRGLIHHATSSSLEESISQGCRVCSQLPVLFNEEVKRKGPIIDNPKLREDISSTYFHLYDLHYRRFSVTLEFRNNTGNSWQLYHAFEISPTEILSPLERRFPFAGYTGSKGSMDLIKLWYTDCYNNHEACRQSGDTCWAPTRLLDLAAFGKSQSSHLRITQQSDPKARYATLSHCWGPGVPLRLQKNNLAKMSKFIKYTDLPKTFQDAVSLARHCSIRYLWIDALCIIQDSLEDWEQEARLMDRVYQNSTLNICASDSRDSYGGCFKSRDLTPLRPAIFSVEKEGMQAKFMLKEWRVAWHFDNLAYEGCLYRRGWVMQERLLPLRLIHCKEKELIWECQTKLASELYPAGDSRSSPSEGIRRLFRQSTPDSLPLVSSTDRQLEQLFVSWAYMVVQYSTCSLTRGNDKFIAIAGLVKKLEPRLGRYIAGLWETCLVRGLSWQATQPIRSTKPPGYRAPSWSWASVDTAIYYVSASQEIDPPVEVVKVLNVEISGDIGQVNSGNLRLFGKVISAHIFGESRDDKWTITIAIANRQGSTQTVSTSEWTLLGDRLHVSVDDLAEISTTPKDIFILPVRIRTVYIPHGKCYECMLLRTINRGEYCRVGFAQVHPNLANWKSLDFESMLNDTVPAEITIF